MVILSKIYTKTGDGGTTALGDGTRISKFDIRVEAYGSVDELNASIGLVTTIKDPTFEHDLQTIQQDLFDLGADLCNPEKQNSSAKPLRISIKQVERIECEIDQMNEKLLPLKSFILPGGNQLASNLHLCRTICRRAERKIVELNTRDPVNKYAVHYLNRLSDWFFVAARIANNNGKSDVLWKPGANQ